MTTGKLTGKVALVTGSARGIGRAIALKLAKEGASLVINYAGSTAQAQEVVEAIEVEGGSAIAIQGDVSSVADIQRLFDRTIEHFGKIDILVNNAGILTNKKIADFTEAEFDKIFAVNVKGTFFACQQAAQRLADGGRIINFSSSTTLMMLPTYGAYVATKGAVEQLTRVLAKEVGQRGITVNVISPGPIDTTLFREGKTEAQIQYFVQASALGRLGEVQDIADIVAFLASDDSRWITGQNIRANGGII
ncbi:SDR family oxidoreductase [Kamptonema sp. UHCC 0994]|uniref:SDR family oxidoreductase n=1 Tax=Kamptonema sp. UHCC 0994 TaxID=3031329 RepID=UPI0023BA2D09|nr:SDR family oxidoreductase [Kamptonema sp. UHCC 0994]MDF0555434.1 SDR family oxidoreductase [Kamptonema sp. UHCC 0994]